MKSDGGVPTGKSVSPSKASLSKLGKPKSYGSAAKMTGIAKNAVQSGKPAKKGMQHPPVKGDNQFYKEVRHANPYDPFTKTYGSSSTY